jgi:hypothetical protein
MMTSSRDSMLRVGLLDFVAQQIDTLLADDDPGFELLGCRRWAFARKVVTRVRGG